MAGASEVGRILGFEPNDFIQEVRDIIQQSTKSGIDSLQQELKLVATNKKLPLKEDELNESCLLLREKISESFDKNMKKFEIYTNRNIFSLPLIETPQIQPKETSPPQASTQSEIEELDHSLIELQEKYTTILSELMQQNECVACLEQQLGQIQSSMFQLRVSSQSLEELNMLPIASNVTSLNEETRSISSLIKKANDLNCEIKGLQNPSPRSQDNDVIQISDISDIQLLNQALSE